MDTSFSKSEISNDRRLLERAAKACGYDTSHAWNAKRLALNPPMLALCINGVSSAWNPLDDNDSAFRLVTHFGMNLYTNDRYCVAEMVSDGESPAITYKQCCDSTTRAAAARRAIVQVAAALADNQEFDILPA